MSVQQTINNLHKYCESNSANFQIWQGKNSTYHWNRGKDTPSGLVNGVVRKLAGIDSTGRQIWAVAGSFKIAPDGTILRFTGIPKSVQKQLSTITIKETV